MTTSPEPVVAERRHLVNLAYRLLGSLTEAEDAVQETYARWYALSPAQQEAISSPGAWLTTVAGRICLDVLGSARVRRERYVGEWLPEPLPDQPDPADRITLDESVSMAFLVALEAMTPAQRVALVLHDVFGYSFAEVAETTGRTPAACRELASAARRRIRADRPAVSVGRQAGLVRDFKEAWAAGDIGTLVGLLDPDATLTADGGGRVRAAIAPIEGGELVARYVAELASSGELTLEERMVNGRPGLVLSRGDELAAVYSFAVKDGRITRIWAMRNPEKLGPWLG
ncbi:MULTISPECIES: RNA polymerase sigma factor SigJ [unclassified Amycolatopsis]|uniref:RNA polymerase sigma factor SigJ n=1 Tax=unclassified Amycolatopsis TaxID=2618356 RepID=UPI002874F27F|nr:MULTISPECIES: RNA polymerase sigma factor SigJ [unclassified Amycolatopsis]MDS0137666.1 RNA polymerase sigma factor SigJ [Amycolatopsis sp. 505]MDS0141861.1 RNA polymerase sigma factor SigJ [Amycolatopsis sp. CM201R]